jgi:hypothetical protein
MILSKTGTRSGADPRQAFSPSRLGRENLVSAISTKRRQGGRRPKQFYNKFSVKDEASVTAM